MLVLPYLPGVDFGKLKQTLAQKLAIHNMPIKALCSRAVALAIGRGKTWYLISRVIYTSPNYSVLAHKQRASYKSKGY